MLEAEASVRLHCNIRQLVLENTHNYIYLGFTLENRDRLENRKEEMRLQKPSPAFLFSFFKRLDDRNRVGKQFLQ